ncbi:MurT ligase domain-containing protein [Porcincola intestinalis]|uniref:MurT ligase domain-containing protein n=1 Tax=Porcincola intestinalis TaxID=2606632 RepID=UPI002A817A76|nr:MurT ligase domain-containing protein [Porcincola intestinalis]MDY4205747.1 MurT ligase domain-containing protein [Porcincola intestinalis]
MGFRTSLAIASAKLLSFACKVAGKQGVTMAGKLAMRIDPDILKKLSAQVRGEIIVTCGTNGKTTTNNLICSAYEAEGRRVVCNHTGSNMLMGVAAAFVLASNVSGKLDADNAVIEVDEASAKRVFPHMKPDYMVLTNLFRDQLDRYGEIDITMNLLKEAMDMAPDMTIIVNADDSLSSYLALESGHEVVTYGISEQVFHRENDHEIREGQFCKKCGHRMVYDFYHFSQLGIYHCPQCGFRRPDVDFDACHISLKGGLSFDVAQRAAGEGQVPLRHIEASYRGFYNIYNILACYAAVKTCGLKTDHFDEMLKKYRPEFGRNELFRIGASTVLLNLAKNPAGFNQNISSVMEDESPKDLIIVINDNAQDGTDISWLWDVDFDRFADESIRSITVSGLRCQDMRLRLKYVGIHADLETDVRTAIEKRLKDGCGNLYVLVNYTALYSTHKMLGEMEGRKEGAR